MIAVKVKLPSDDEVRRFSLSSTANFDELTAKLSQFGINLASGQHKLTYLDDENDLVSLRSDEELAEAVNLARASNPGILHLTIKKLSKKLHVPQESIPEPQESGCPFSSGRWAAHCRSRASRDGPCSFRARPGCVVAGVLGAVVIFKILSFLSYFLGCWAFFGLAFLGFRFFMRRRCARRMAEAGVAPSQAGGCPFSQRRPCFSFATQNVRVTETEPSTQSSSSSTTSPSSSAPQTQPPATPLTQSGNSENVKNKFETLLNTLSEMGFTDRALNIEKLVANRLNLSATIQSLLSN